MTHSPLISSLPGACGLKDSASGPARKALGPQAWRIKSIMNPVKELEKHGQAVWLDFLARGFIAKGDLKRLIDDDGVKGVTSNPSIFEKAIGSSDEYDAPIGKALQKGDRSIAELFEQVAIEDIQHAADVLRPVYDSMHGKDGYVSLEASPYLANDTEGRSEEHTSEL